MGKIFIGTSGYMYKDWREIFYPKGLSQRHWLTFYSQHFKTVEINATFYGSFASSTFARWYRQTPDDFLFSIKGSRFITHIKRLQVSQDDIAGFFDQLIPLHEKLSCVLWQMPGNFRYTEASLGILGNFLQLLPKDIRQAIEFRDSSWFDDSVWKVLEQENIAFVISQTSEFATLEKVTADFSYVRLHGPAKLYASKYSDEELQVWAEKVGTLIDRGDVYCYFNNDYSGYALENAKELEEMVKRDFSGSTSSPLK